MPRGFMFTKEEILNVALDLAREGGIDAVTARALGKRLGTSSRPVFGRFESMAEVQSAVRAAAYRLYTSYLKNEIEDSKYPPYKASGMAYIRFAREEKELFKLLFMCDRDDTDKSATSPETKMLTHLISDQVGISEEEASLFYLEMWAYVHGIATMLATGFFDWDEELASRTLTDMYEGLKSKYEKKKQP